MVFRRHTGIQGQAARRGEASEEQLAAVKRPRLLYCVTHGFFLQDVAPRPAEWLAVQRLLQARCHSGCARRQATRLS